MTEVEKLYELAGVEKKLYCDICKAQEHALGLCAETKCDVFYPPFTAEKQIELIKKLGNINIDIDNGCYMSSEILEVEAHCDDFEETLAEFVINLWQDLTSDEQEQIREILK